MNAPLTAADLNRHHLGHLIWVTKEDASVTDTLSGISHIADLIDERRITDEVPDIFLGRITTSLTFANLGSLQVAGDTEVQVMS